MERALDADGSGVRELDLPAFARPVGPEIEGVRTRVGEGAVEDAVVIDEPDRVAGRNGQQLRGEPRRAVVELRGHGCDATGAASIGSRYTTARARSAALRRSPSATRRPLSDAGKRVSTSGGAGSSGSPMQPSTRQASSVASRRRREASPAVVGERLEHPPSSAVGGGP